MYLYIFSIERATGLHTLLYVRLISLVLRCAVVKVRAGTWPASGFFQTLKTIQFEKRDSLSLGTLGTLPLAGYFALAGVLLYIHRFQPTYNRPRVEDWHFCLSYSLERR